MTQREFIQAGIRLLGFWLLVTGVISLVTSLTPSILMSVFPPEGLRGQRLSDYWVREGLRPAFALLQSIYALYLCRGSDRIVEFLSRQRGVSNAKTAP